MATLFISDLHLCPSRPQIGRLFFDFLSGPAREADALYILGDLFEHWAGDDDLDDPSNAEVCVALQALSASGVALFFMAGNRDFLCGETFAKAAGLKLLPDPALIEIAGTATLLMHGDTLCTDDDAYQAFRAEVRSPEWRQAFLTLPLDRRKARIEALRRESEAQKRVKPTDIMDANPGAVLQTLTFHRCTRLIHGHTHRPARHLLDVAGRAAERWVLPDWYEAGGYLACDATGCRLLSWPPAAA
ncbi:MAG: UDP-2,3-diacylglucosamine diphosphatase [Burkholderiales bacterium]|jgi:UDP-2,3-diacylglucosamine hydrolase|uniref:UDP-2,3-diacylglucosamine hydrolase n=1 Tax=Candidatus Desulfobacillus denitrificans TaxID=2608985 RepID=A0A809S9N6_9PROT|nr:UDP-2,3-diacylglucosamine diphosphatase [Zoogloeaceae bacterium]MBP9653475.1 UDP-2,3-diacylglucosamine diphosphatase [Rhodocyclaceae bacterium]MCZ2175692.1 UDP-2,3-diacylglucosamine diphosphatase [Burkholderiales bacterium]OQY68362.1 MAG: UDP-2,3-diacylglucosamine diphosphatase [Rhodocyclaceae bacterium UTPRO2]BBO20364.1 UDP-2,3-diacylglucosamine diphosphatase [Candidatus Desulfobacillus denitrificans]GIK44564.1 MAG: UDP-2,3-diacylglucosamine hydrolase [Betaproteobacteria bacterium]